MTTGRINQVATIFNREVSLASKAHFDRFPITTCASSCADCSLSRARENKSIHPDTTGNALSKLTLAATDKRDATL